MPPREIQPSGASAVPGIIPDLPHIGPELLEVPGMVEYNQRLQKWWDQFRSSQVNIQVRSDSSIRRVSASVQTVNGELTAAIEEEMAVRAEADGYLAGKYTLKVIAGNVVTGMNITSESGAGTDISDITFQATSFKVYNGTTGLAPFQIVGSKIRFTGNVEIDGSLLLAGTLTVNYSDIGGTKPPSDADKTESALITGTTITGGGITLSAGGSIKGGASNFSTGTGFFLGYEGGQYKFRVGNPAGARIEWDGSAWTVVSFPGAVPSYTLTLTPSTGNPLDNPSGGDSYTIGTRVNIVAPAMGTSGAFQRWSGSDPHVSMIDDPFSNNTYVTVIGDMGLIADYP